jgi:hypothetical protein
LEKKMKINEASTTLEIEAIVQAHAEELGVELDGSMTYGEQACALKDKNYCMALVLYDAQRRWFELEDGH